jgi:hypothetical protein
MACELPFSRDLESIAQNGNNSLLIGVMALPDMAFPPGPLASLLGPAAEQV